MSYRVLSALALALLGSLYEPAGAAAAKDDVEVRAFVNGECIVADEPFFAAEAGAASERSLALLGVVVGKLTEVLLQHAVKAGAHRMSARGARQDTRYAMARQMNLYLANLRPSPSLALNGEMGCMTVVAGRFKPDPADCTAQYQPRTLTPETMRLPQAEWRSSRTDDSLENPLRRANVCTDGEPSAVFESRFEFSEDGTAYRLESVGYNIASLLSTRDPKAERSMFYTLEISQPSANDKGETLTTAWVNLGRVRAGAQGTSAGDSPAPWLRVPALSTDARRAYEQETRVHQDTWAQIEALQRAIVRKQRIVEGLRGRLAAATPEVAQGLKAEIVRGEVQIQTLEAELEARRAEYAELPQKPLELMPVLITVGITESASEKRTLLALAEIVEKNSGALASTASGLIGSVARSVDASDRSAVILSTAVKATPDPVIELDAARASYFDALVNARMGSKASARVETNDELARAKARYDAARRTLRLNTLP